MKNNLLEFALGYERIGWFVLPADPVQKKPLVNWAHRRDRRPTPDEIREWWQKFPDARIAIATGECSGFDAVDADGQAGLEKIESICGGLPVTITQTTGRNEGGRHLLFKNNGHALRPYQDGVLDLRTTGSIIIVAPSAHKSGKKYSWDNIDPIKDGLDDLADWPPELVEHFRSISNPCKPPNGPRRPITIDPVPAGERHQALVRLVGKWLHQGLDDETILLTARGWWAALPDKTDFSLEELEAQVKDLIARYRKPTPNPILETAAIDTNEVYKALSKGEDGDAALFIRLHKGKLCYDHAERRWYEFIGHFWAKDRTCNATAAVSRVIEIYAEEAKRQSELKHKAVVEERKDDQRQHEAREKALLKRVSLLHDAKKKADVLVLAAAGPDSLGVSGDEWDSDLSLIGCPNGVIELKTGQLRPGRPEDYVRTVTNAEWRGVDAECPTWEKTIHEIFDGNIELADYIQRLFGYGLTGVAHQHIIPILWGIGRNGKGTILENLKNVLGGYAYKADSELLLQQKFSRHAGAPNTAILSLRGKRIVWCSETPEGRRMDAARVKELCGGDTLNARGLYGKDHVEFRPSHLLMLITNFKPSAPANDYALWQRIRLIPFERSFVPNPKEPHERKADQDLPEKLKAEASGILAWLVRGCLKYHAEGLQTPEAVEAAGSEYQAEEDTVGQFIEECCILEETAQVQAGALYSAYSEWCRDCNVKPMANTSFGKEMTRRGFDRYQKRNWFWMHIGLINEHTGKGWHATTCNQSNQKCETF